MKNNLTFTEQQYITSENIAFVTAAVSLTVAQRTVRASSSAALGGAYSITLPNVSAAAGMIFAITADSIANGATITVQDNDESEQWADLDLTATADHVVLYSDGITWHLLHDTTT